MILGGYGKYASISEKTDGKAAEQEGGFFALPRREDVLWKAPNLDSLLIHDLRRWSDLEKDSDHASSRPAIVLPLQIGELYVQESSHLHSSSLSCYTLVDIAPCQLRAKQEVRKAAVDMFLVCSRRHR